MNIRAPLLHSKYIPAFRDMLLQDFNIMVSLELACIRDSIHDADIAANFIAHISQMSDNLMQINGILASAETVMGITNTTQVYVPMNDNFFSYLMDTLSTPVPVDAMKRLAALADGQALPQDVLDRLNKQQEIRAVILKDFENAREVDLGSLKKPIQPSTDMLN